jgi:ElaA protein
MLELKKISTPEELGHCHRIRLEVFVHDQKVPVAEEFDDSDKGCEHYLLWNDTVPVGTVRVRSSESYIKIERVAVLKAYSGKGYGTEMMSQLLTELQKDPTRHLFKLGAQTRVIPFYEKFGFAAFGEEYLDGGIPHKNMTLDTHLIPTLSGIKC